MRAPLPREADRLRPGVSFTDDADVSLSSQDGYNPLAQHALLFHYHHADAHLVPVAIIQATDEQRELAQGPIAGVSGARRLQDLPLHQTFPESGALDAARQLGERAHAHLLLQARTVDLYGLLAGSEVPGDLLVALALEELLEHFPFPRREVREELRHARAFCLRGAREPRAGERRLNRGKQLG